VSTTTIEPFDILRLMRGLSNREPRALSQSFIWMNKVIELRCYENSTSLEKVSALFRAIVGITPEISYEPFVAYLEDNMVYFQLSSERNNQMEGINSLSLIESSLETREHSLKGSKTCPYLNCGKQYNKLSNLTTHLKSHVS
jgi:hypothetical protein